MSTGIDCARRLTAQTAAAIRAEGYAFAGRYLVPESGTLRWKALTLAEAEAITCAGLRILTVFETTADRARGGAVAGTADGQSARICAEKLRMPPRGVIYFAVDYEAQAADLDSIEAYLRAARRQTGPYEIGVYGSYSVVEAMRSRGACGRFWQCVAWSYGKISTHHNVYQHTAQRTVAGVAVDLNECRDMDLAGIWTYEEDNDMDVEKLLEAMTDEQAWRLVEKANRHAATLEPSRYAWDACRAGVDSGYFSDGDHDGLVDNPQALLKRQELATVLYRAGIIK